MPIADVDAAVIHPDIIIASDSIGSAHPRSAGTFTRVLSHYVRESQQLSLMQALRKMTLLPAKRLEKTVPQMKLRGRLQKGMIADITIFDPVTVSDRASYIQPALDSVGIAHVLVSGTPVLENYEFVTNAYPGQAIKR